ncbi:hypothetical protein ACJMK2_034251 [Sinanodonta woodiana]|uniref:Uncharacterized protein n=1 Tax=Sinanodonta woodiana TaxID=1069815 RepID=A0ABD3WRK3_SINWO
MLRIVLAVVLVVTIKGEGCCPYDAWEGFEGLLTGTVQGGQSHLTQGAFTLHLNNTKRMVASEVDLVVDGVVIRLKSIQDYNTGTEYDIMDGKCTKKPIGQWKPQCIPDDAKVVQNTYIGAGSEKVAVKTYLYTDNGLQVYATVTASGCIPVMAAISGTTAQGVPTVSVVEFSGITSGIKDPSVFSIPAICNSLDIPHQHIPIFKGLRRSFFH